jgi:hypothetical protein
METPYRKHTKVPKRNAETDFFRSKSWSLIYVHVEELKFTTEHVGLDEVNVSSC